MFSNNSQRQTPGSWIHQKLIVEKFNNWFGFIILLTAGLLITILASSGGMEFSIVALLAIVAIPVALVSAISLKTGFYLLLFLTSFMPVTERIFYLQINAGTYIDIFIYYLLVIALIKKIISNDWKFIRHPITVLLLIFFFYNFLQLFNPAGDPTAWFFGIRLIFRFVCVYIIAESVFRTRKDIFGFAKVWLFIGLLAAIYAMYQEWVGLPSFDMHWATKTPERQNLLWMGNRFRKWSFLSDVANFGLFMAFAGLMAFFLSLAKFKIYKKVILIILGLLFWVAMVYSGTRTAYAIIPVGVALYFFMNINKVKTLAFGVIAGMTFIFLYFAPIYNPSLNRLRSAFSPSEDASMNLRDLNRQSIQPYIYSHPLGGGLNTTGTPGLEYSPGHPLAGFPPDSGFLKTLLETGWLGLMLQMAFYVVVLATGIKSYYLVNDQLLKRYLLAFIASFFALTVALYAKLTIEGFPLLLIIASNIVIMYRVRDFDKKEVAVGNESAYD